MSLSASKILLEKNGIKIVKENATHFTIEFEIANANVDLTNFISIDFLKLVHDLNPDIFESIAIQKIDEGAANILLVYKDLFADLGLPHFYCCFQITKHANTFILLPIDFKPSDTKKNLVLMPIDKGEIIFHPLSAQQILFKWTIHFTPPDLFSGYVEKMIGLLLFKVLNRVKQFIYNLQ
jgi:hypothetical protein